MSRQEVLEKLLDQHGASRIIEVLGDQLTDRRREKIEWMLERRLKNIQVAVETPYDLHNALAVVRTSEALGVYQNHIIGWKKKKRRGKGTMQGANAWSDTFHHRDIHSFAALMHEKGFLIAGAELNGQVSIEQLGAEKPICLILGNEKEGLSDEALGLCDVTYKIPMYGMTESYNLSVSAAISLYHHVQQKRKKLAPLKTDLSPEDYMREKAWCYIRSIGIGRACSSISMC